MTYAQFIAAGTAIGIAVATLDRMIWFDGTNPILLVWGGMAAIALAAYACKETR